MCETRGELRSLIKPQCSELPDKGAAMDIEDFGGCGAIVSGGFEGLFYRLCFRVGERCGYGTYGGFLCCVRFSDASRMRDISVLPCRGGGRHGRLPCGVETFDVSAEFSDVSWP